VLLLWLLWRRRTAKKSAAKQNAAGINNPALRREENSPGD
jgi:hypothetical protein